VNRLILIRHGETVWNAERRFTTRSDVELSDAGLAQAAAAARALESETIDRIYTSPLQRAARTAGIIAGAQRAACPVTADDRLVEIDAGPFEGKTSEELEAGTLAAAFAAWHTDDAEPVFPDGAEPFADALRRASAFLHEHAGEPGTTLIVTHGSLARLIVCSHFLGGPPPLHRRLWLDNCRLAVFEERQGVPKMVAFNAAGVG
jgi:broad specificity phosphatase PhoE